LKKLDILDSPPFPTPDTHSGDADREASPTARTDSSRATVGWGARGCVATLMQDFVESSSGVTAPP
jgi:hypothetical protein